MDLIMTGRIVGADEALQIGLVNRICKPGTGKSQSLNLNIFPSQRTKERISLLIEE